jgi:HD-GYP domain-containing protein (c-di-GMP phosphodiesterase class II)
MDGKPSLGVNVMRAQETRKRIFSQNLKVFYCYPARNWSASFIPLNLRGLMAGERLTFNLYLKVNDGEEFKYLSYLEAGEVLEYKWLAPLARMDIKHLYFHQEDLEKALAYLNNHLQLLEVEGAAQTKKKLNVLGEHLNLTLRQVFSAPRLGPHINLAEKQIDRIIEEFQRDKLSPKMVWEILYRNYSLYNHSVNVCLLAVAMMLFLKKSNRESRLMGSAALFIDLGMTRISEGILDKTGGLTPEEWEETKKHPLIGKQMLRCHSTLPAEGVQLVMEHHENADGSGYPEGLSLPRQHPWTRILRLLDAYDAITTFRPYRAAQTPFAALKFLQKQESCWGPIFEPRTIRNLIRFLALA